MLTGSTTLSPPRSFRAIFLDRSPHHLGARRMTCLAGLSFWDGRDILVAGPTFLQKKTLWPARGQPVFSYKRLLKMNSAGRLTLLPGTGFLHINGALLKQ